MPSCPGLEPDAMTEKFFPLTDYRSLNNVPEIPSVLEAPGGLLSDTLARPLRDLRISVTDHCNFRCVYCMPKEVFGRDFQFLEREELLTFEEIARLARVFVACGVRKIRITGGEPLVRRNIERLIEQVARIEGLRDLTMTTNGALLASK